MKTLSEADQRSSAVLKIVFFMALLFVVCTLSTEPSSAFCFSITCCAMLSMMQLASVSNSSFDQRYGWLTYVFIFALCVHSIIFLVRNSSRAEDILPLLYLFIPVLLFLIAYSWYLRTKGVESTSRPIESLKQFEAEAITKNCSDVLDRPL